ncbi:hypothetical protein TWF694_007089 [Orbilia ellipsospora]
MMAPKLSPLKLTFGGIVFLSIVFFSLSSYRVSSVLPINDEIDSSLPDITANCPEYIPRNESELDVEQIQADFPNGYKNPNNWFKTPGQPNSNYLTNLLTDEEAALLPSFKAKAKPKPEYIAKIESLYGIKRAGSWQDHINSLDDDNLAPLTKWAQQYIYDYQHPESCEGKKFYVLVNKWPRHGLGAIIRRTFIELSLAMQTGRILVLDSKNAPGNTLVEKDCDKHRGKTASLECILEDLTSCASYVTSKNSVNAIDMTETKEGGLRDYPALPAMAMMTYLGELGIVPSGTFLRYWWRSQLYGYVLRPNRAALNRISEMRLNKSLHSGVNTNRSSPSEPQNTTVPFPLPPSTLSMHIRHGDKGGEGRLISTRDYIVAAERFLLRNPLKYVKRAFMSTEDPGAIEEARQTPFVNPVRSYGNVDWTWFYSHIPRVDGGPGANLELTHNKTDALLTHIMQLWMAVECDT